MSAPQAFRGEKLGLPSAGTGSLATTGPRLGAFVADVIASTIVAALFVQGHGSTFADKLPGSWSLIPLAVDPARIASRTALLFLLVPALIFDRDGRGLHDRLTDTAVVRA